MEEIREQEQAQKARLEEQRKRDLERMGIKPHIEGQKEEPEQSPIPTKKAKKEPVKWIYKKIVVKVMNKKLGEKFYKKKAFIEVTEGFVAVVQGKLPSKSVRIKSMTLYYLLHAMRAHAFRAVSDLMFPFFRFSDW